MQLAFKYYGSHILGKSRIDRAFNILRCDICSLKRALEPAVRAGKERTKAGTHYEAGWEGRDYGKNNEIVKSLSIEKNSIYGL
jgi:hypothetical protein